MKKQLLSFVSILGLTTISYAQTEDLGKRFHVSFEKDAAYTPLSSDATQPVIYDWEGEVSEDWDDDLTEPITFPFPFYYQNTLIENINIETNGYIFFNASSMEEIYERMFALSMDYASNGRGKIFYETTGAEGSRIFKIEFSNVSSFMNYTGNDTFNFQVWFHESNNVIEYRTGYSNVPQEFFIQNYAESMSEGLDQEELLAALLTNEGDYLSDNYESIYIQYIQKGDDTYTDSIFNALIAEEEPDEIEFIENLKIFLNKYPDNGTVFRFTPIPVSKTAEIPVQELSIYPVPSNDNITVQLSDNNLMNSVYTIFDVNGRQVTTGRIIHNQTNINIQNLPQGNYFLKITTDERESVRKIIKN